MALRTPSASPATAAAWNPRAHPVGGIAVVLVTLPAPVTQSRRQEAGGIAMAMISAFMSAPAGFPPPSRRTLPRRLVVDIAD